MDSEKPLMQRNVRALHHRASAARELVAAVVAQEHAGLRLPAHAANGERSAMRASNGAIRPARGLDMLAGGVFVMEAGFGKANHWNLLWFEPYPSRYAKSSA